MLFALPRFGDYQGGFSLLGLGDIVLPGLLLSFAIRLDLSKVFVGLHNDVASDDEEQQQQRRVGGGPSKSRAKMCGGYFPFLCVGYGVGLMMANAAVYLMEMGQPALLYLVPCTLGVMAYLGCRWGEWKELWAGPRVIEMADKLLFDDEDDEEEGLGLGEQEVELGLGEGENDTVERNMV